MSNTNVNIGFYNKHKIIFRGRMSIAKKMLLSGKMKGLCLPNLGLIFRELNAVQFSGFKLIEAIILLNTFQKFPLKLIMFWLL